MSPVPSITGGRTFRFAPLLAATVITILLLRLFGSIADLLLLLFIAILISLFLGGVAAFFQRRLSLSRRVAFTLAIVASLLGLVGLVWLLVPPVVEQTQQLVRVLPTYIEAWETGIERSMQRLPALREFFPVGQHRILRAVYDQVAAQMQNVVPRVVSIVHAAISIFSVAVMGLYLALTPGVYREWLIAFFPPLHRDLVRDVLTDLGVELRAYIVAQLLAMGILAALTAVGLYILQVPYWLTFGVFTGLVAIVPFFGTLVSTTLPALFVLGGTGVWGLGAGTHALLVVLLGVLIHLIEGNLVGPLIFAGRLKLPPVLTIMSVLIVGKLLGALGLIVALPLLTATLVIVRRILLNRIYEGQGFRKSTRDRALVLRVPAPDGGVMLSDGPPSDLIAIAELRASA